MRGKDAPGRDRAGGDLSPVVASRDTGILGSPPQLAGANSIFGGIKALSLSQPSSHIHHHNGHCWKAMGISPPPPRSNRPAQAAPK